MLEEAGALVAILPCDSRRPRMRTPVTEARLLVPTSTEHPCRTACPRKAVREALIVELFAITVFAPCRS